MDIHRAYRRVNQFEHARRFGHRPLLDLVASALASYLDASTTSPGRTRKRESVREASLWWLKLLLEQKSSELYLLSRRFANCCYDLGSARLRTRLCRQAAFATIAQPRQTDRQAARNDSG